MNRRNFLGVTALSPMIAKPANMSLRTFLEEIFGITTIRSIFGDFWLPYTTVYKLVNPDYSSVNQFSLPCGFGLQYKIGSKVDPKVGKIFAYSSLNDVDLDLANNYGDRKVLECKTRYCQPGHWWEKLPFDSTDHEMEKLWQNESGQPKTPRKGIMYCDNVEVVREI